MTFDLNALRRFYAEEIEAVGNLRTPALVDALASVPRERFLRPGPWLIRGEGDFAGPPRWTPDADPRRVYHNCAVAIDPQRQLFNGAPGVVAPLIDALGLTPGARVVHAGAGLGYYSALLAQLAGERGHVLALEVDEALCAEAAANLSSMPWVDVQRGDATRLPGSQYDAILVNAGVTHPQDAWLEALAPGGRLILPLTATLPAMGPTIGKGVMTMLTRTAGGDFAARMMGLVVIYSGVGLRDESLNVQIAQALGRSPFPRFTRLRRDAHERGAACWLHAETFCLSLD